MKKHTTLFLTHRGQFHQQNVLSAAPEMLEITMCRDASKHEVIALLPEMEFLITEREETIDADIIAAGKKLRLIQRLGAQTWDIDLAAAEQAGIPVCYWPDQSCVNVAEHSLMMTLDLMKRTRDMIATMNAAAWTKPSLLSDEDTFAYNWSGRQGVDTLRHKTVGILGFGEIGREIVNRLRGFECRVLYNKRRRMPAEAEQEMNITFASQDELVQQSDVIYCLLPFIKEANQSMNAALFSKMKPHSYFIFCGGSGMVEENALMDALRSGHLAGAGLDTYTYEPLPASSPLCDLQRDLSVNLVLTPHVAAGTYSGGRGGDYTNLVRLLEGQELLYQVGRNR